MKLTTCQSMVNRSGALAPWLGSAFLPPPLVFLFLAAVGSDRFMVEFFQSFFDPERANLGGGSWGGGCWFRDSVFLIRPDN